MEVPGRLAAVELIQTIPGIKGVGACAIIAEIGPDMKPFADSGHISGWGGICPGNNESAGKQFSGKIRSGNIWLKRILCQVAWSAARTHNTYFAAQFHRLAAKRGKKRAVVAVAHSILVTIYAMLKTNKPYQDLGGDYFEKLNRDGLKRYCVRKLEAMGLRVVLEPAA
jgi:transposase